MVIEHEQATLSHNLTLPETEVHVWSALLSQSREIVEEFLSLLSPDEKHRAARFQFEHLRDSFIVARGLLRILLADYLNLEPGQLQFSYKPAGKPELSGNLYRKIFFNLSHSNEIVLYAFSNTSRVGVDVEYIRPIDDIDQIAKHNFSMSENVQLKSLAHEQMLDGFFNCWTRKEAYIKAIGDGVSFPLDQFDVSLRPGEPARLLSICGSKEEAARWSMLELHPADNYAAALVVEGSRCSVSYREWKRFDFVYSA